MVSAAEQLAKNFSFSSFTKAKELKSRIWFTLGALIVFRIGTYIPVPGVDPQILKDIFQQQQGGVLGVVNVFAGGALGRMAIFCPRGNALHLGEYYCSAYDECVPNLRCSQERGNIRAAKDQSIHPVFNRVISHLARVWNGCRP